MMQSFVAQSLGGSEYYVTLRRNDSLGSAGRWGVFAALCAASLGLALAFTAFGAWPMLPYSVLEMGVLFWALRWLERHAADWESISGARGSGDHRARSGRGLHPTRIQSMLPRGWGSRESAGRRNSRRVMRARPTPCPGCILIHA